MSFTSVLDKARRALRKPLSMAAALAAAAATGCAPDAPVRAPCPAGEVCLAYGNVSEPATLDTHKSTGTWEDRILSDAFMGLTQDAQDGSTIPGMAERWETSADGLTWRFYLRDATWSDGVPVTADDFVFSLRRILNPETASEYASLLYFIKGAQPVNEGSAAPETLGVRAVAPKVLEIQLEHPAPYILELAKHSTMLPVPKHVVEAKGDAWVRDFPLVSNGAYTIQEWRLGDYVLSRKNPRFFEADQVCVDQIRYYPTPDAITAERRVRAGELDLNRDVQSNRISRLREEIPGYVHTYTYLGVAYLAFNTNIEAFKDVRVRRALNMAIDRQFITQKLLRGGQEPAYTFVPPGVANYSSPPAPEWSTWPLERRQAEARRLLAEAGYGPQNPLRFAIKHRNSADPMLFMPAVQADWKEIGVEVALNQNEGQIAYAAYRVRDFEVADAAWIADFNDAMSFLYLQNSSTGPQNYGDYRNPRFDALLAQADNEPDPETRAGYMREAERIMLEDAPVAPVYFYVSKSLVSPKVTGWIDNIVDHQRTRYLCISGAN